MRPDQSRADSTHQPNYDRRPRTDTGLPAEICHVGWDAVAARMLAHIGSTEPISAGQVIAVECYPGVLEDAIARELQARLPVARVVSMGAYLLPANELERRFAHDLTDDPVFGVLSRASLSDFFAADRLGALRAELAQEAGSVLVIGPGASLVAPLAATLVYADMPRWEIQARQRRGEIGNLGLSNLAERASTKYKRSFFLDWPAADRAKRALLPPAAFFLDTTRPEEPKLLSGSDYRAALRAVVRRPFRLVPFFDPGPWGGHWMERVFDLPRDRPNYAWCFDCVPEENSLLLGIGPHVFETPALNLVFAQPQRLLGQAVHARFGPEFPIRFDMLDTMGGGNLSLQVHPLTEYIREHFGMAYTQDESYYLLDAEPGATVWLGVKPGVDAALVERDLRRAAEGVEPFRPELYFNQLPAARHDHILIPAGTPHCSGAGSMVLEISATPFLFTFKMWDWARLGLDGRPRPTHLRHALSNIQWERDLPWVQRELVNVITPIAAGEGWREERTGLHTREFIETRRHWFQGPVLHDTGGGVNVLNLVQGRAALIESPIAAFAPFELHYAETVVVPAAVGPYTIRPQAGSPGVHATVKASVRTGLDERGF